MLLDHRLIFVTGKGGVGKSTVALALGIAAARRGKRTLVASLEGDDGLAEHALAKSLHTIQIDAQAAMEEYLRVKVGALGQVLGASRLFGTLAMATPGLRELLVAGKIWELAQDTRRTSNASPYELVIVDAPATGHALALLRAPRTFTAAAKSGPIAEQAGTIQASFDDPRFTAVVAVATAEEMPVNETLQLADSLAADHRELALVIANAIYPDRFSSGEAELCRRALSSDASPAARAALRAADSEHHRAALQSMMRARLAARFGDALLALPYLFHPTLTQREFEQLADCLEATL